MKKREKSKEGKSIRQRRLETSGEGASGSALEGEDTLAARLGRKSLGLAEHLKSYLQRERDPKVIAASALRSAAAAIIAFLFGRTPLFLETYPLAISMLSASGRSVIFILMGAIASSFTLNGIGSIEASPYIYTTAYLLVFFIRIASRLFIDPPEGLSIRDTLRGTEAERKKSIRRLITSLFDENIYLRMASSCGAAFLVSIVRLSNGSYRYFDLFSSMFAIISAPAITFLFSGYGRRIEDSTDRFLRNASEITLLASLVLSLRGTSILGINAGFFAAFFAVLFLSERRGVLFCSAAGLAAGLALSPIYAPAFILAAISAFLMKSSPFASAALASLLAILWGAYIDGLAALSLLMPAIITSSVIYCASGKLIALPIDTAGVSLGERSLEKEYYKTEEERLSSISKAFSHISKELYFITDKLKSPSIAEIREVTLESFESHCDKCSMLSSCKCGNYGAFSESVTSLAEILARDGRIKKEKLPHHLAMSCTSIDEILNEANTEYARLMAKRIEGEKTQLFALDYEAFSLLLSDAAEHIKIEHAIDREFTDALRRNESIRDMGLLNIYAYGNDRKRIFSEDMGKKAEKMGIKELKSELEAACGFKLTDPIFELRGRGVAMRAEAAERYSVTWEIAKKAGRGEKECGDSSVCFKANGRLFALICDGMGSGSEAALTSEICVLFLTKMLESGNRKEIALKMLNNLLRSRSAECSTTVDLMEIDLISGSASFVKSGAAPSFVRRGDKLYKLRSATAPIGIMNAIDAEQVRFEIAEGDIIIMLSDGLGQAPEESCALMEQLGGEMGEDMKGFADSLIEKARELGEEDDATVILLRIEST